MNKIVISVLMALFLVISACDTDTINLDPIGDTEASFFQNEDQMQQAIFGVYQKVSFFYGFRGGQNNHLLPITLLPSDDLTSPAAYAFENFTGLSGSSSQLTLYYQFAYQLIARANTVLEKIEENGEKIYQSKPELLNYNKGEALFLRSLAYFNLWNVFGTAPLITERITDINDAYPPNTTGTQLLDQAIIDLKLASELLPESWSAEYKGRLVKNSAFGLRGKCLVFRGTVNKTTTDFTEAIADFNSIKGVSLTSVYGENFSIEHENNEESLFEYQANDSPANVNPFVGGAGGNDAFAVIGEIGHYLGMFSQLPTWIGNSYFSATESIQKAYDEGDPRKDYNINPDATNLINVMKYLRNNRYANGGSSNGVSVNNPRILRYADVLLLKAEAIVRSNGSLSEAIGLVNQIRERARNSVEGAPSAIPVDRNTSESNAQTVLEWIFQERRLELAFEEGHRWWDLRRRHIAGEIDLKKLDFSSLLIDCKFSDYNVNFPLPSDEVVENPNMDQNTGY
ncbi:RagB/SusD family nutrient uptake outer membrane protein [Massilibacteroides sp.]|uniref:RagB/SusD family nutrient uptake outer membrane protein n=1 Tax=Massilibacteroides sp. TaxID=2034766 RepID=UPI00260F3493|nr:RagB/SusD family nutrient uptake outer membrane protein [Massilibacteroides sp.]MDD4514465.1 RagB/SusD family nutrient uptake outer membrane protein [Massilibacteroides sp.]